jgi:hypothetical protein
MKETIEQILLIATAIVTAIISVLHLLGLLHSVPWLEQQTPALTLLVVAFIAGHLLIERKSKLDKLERHIRESAAATIGALKGAEVRRLEGKDELFRYFARRIRDARKSVDDLTWGPVDMSYGTPASAGAFRRYLEEIPKVCKKKNFVYREVMTFPNEGRLNRAAKMIDRNLPCYHIKYYDLPVKGMPPFFQFLVIDAEEVIFAFYRYPQQPNAGGMHLSVKHPDIVKVFQDYYNSIWLGAIELKEGGRVNRAEIDMLRKRLKAGGDGIYALEEAVAENGSTRRRAETA